MRLSRPSSFASVRGFTLVELVVAVGLLLVVVVATSRIFSTASRVASLGEATSDILQETGAIERQIRTDISRIDFDGMIVIQCVAILNNANQLTIPSAPLIDPSRPANATIRCDQLLFFARGVQTSVRFAGNQDLGPFNGLARSNVARILYGHGVQLPDLFPEGPSGISRPDPISFDDRPLMPWSYDATPAPGGLDYRYWSGGGLSKTNGTQPEARDWTLARQAILLADDGGDKLRLHKAVDNTPTTYGNNSEGSLFERNDSIIPRVPILDGSVADNLLLPSYGILNSRVDVAATNLDDIRRILAPVGSTTWRTRTINGFLGPFSVYGQLAGYVRSEKVSPSMNRQDVMLTTPTLATNCSNFMVDWTWAPEVIGYIPSPLVPTQWFGFPDSQYPVTGTWRDEWRGIKTLTEDPSLTTSPIVPAVIEGSAGTPLPLLCPLGPTGPIKIYTAVFGFNGEKAIFQTLAMQSAGTFGVRNDYTPWPTALRLTMQLHDPEKRLEQGRTLQLIVELPKRPAS